MMGDKIDGRYPVIGSCIFERYTLTKTQLDQYGRVVFRYQDDRGGMMEQKFDRNERAILPQVVVVTDKDGSSFELQRTAGGEMRGTRKDRNGTIIAPDAGYDDCGPFARTVGADGTVTKTYEDGTAVTVDAKGNLLSHKFKDRLGREIRELYKAHDGVFEGVRCECSGDIVGDECQSISTVLI